MKKFFTLCAAAMMVMAAKAEVIYSWESAGAEAVTETGGTMVCAGGAGATLNRLNYANGDYFTICLNGKKGNMNDATDDGKGASMHMVLTLDKALADGDKFVVTAYYNKGEEKAVSMYMYFENGTEFTTENYTHDIAVGAEPETKTFTVANTAGCKVIKLSRGSAGTNLFITKFVINRGTTGLEAVKSNAAVEVRNILGQVVSQDAKGLVIVNGKKEFRF